MINFDKRFRFRNFQVYKDTRDFNIDIKKLAGKFPVEEKYALSSQLLRASISVILNIAEGSDRGTDKDFALFLNRAHTSLNEIVACFDIALDSNYINLSEHNIFLEKAANLANQLTAFRKKILANPNK